MIPMQVKRCNVYMPAQEYIEQDIDWEDYPDAEGGIDVEDWDADNDIEGEMDMGLY
jgi:hypothetical protein